MIRDECPEPTFFNGPDTRDWPSSSNKPLPYQCVECQQIVNGIRGRWLHEANTGHFGWRIPIEAHT